MTGVHFTEGDTLEEMLSIDMARGKAQARQADVLMDDQGFSPLETLKELSETQDFTANEWTAFCFLFGGYVTKLKAIGLFEEESSDVLWERARNAFLGESDTPVARLTRVAERYREYIGNTLCDKGYSDDDCKRILGEIEAGK